MRRTPARSRRRPTVRCGSRWSPTGPRLRTGRVGAEHWEWVVCGRQRQRIGRRGWRRGGLVPSSNPRSASSSISASTATATTSGDSPKASASSTAIVCVVAVPSQHCHSEQPGGVEPMYPHASRGRTTDPRGRAGSDRRRFVGWGRQGQTSQTVPPGTSVAQLQHRIMRNLKFNVPRAQRWKRDRLAVRGDGGTDAWPSERTARPSLDEPPGVAARIVQPAGAVKVSPDQEPPARGGLPAVNAGAGTHAPRLLPSESTGR